MKQAWTIQRRTVEYRDGQRRWDLAYQCLVSWVESAKQATLGNQTNQEVQDASSDLCSRVDARSDANANH